MYLRKLLLIVCFITMPINCVLAKINDAAVKVPWSYKGDLGPARWALLSPDFALCASSKSQSPINIEKSVSNADHVLEVHYEPMPISMMVDGVTKFKMGQDVLLVNNGHTIQVDYLGPKKSEYVSFDKEKYRLIQFHYHSPSETELRKQSFPAEFHFVHQSDAGKLLVLAVLVMTGEANLAIQQIIDNVPSQKNVMKTVPNQKISPVNFMPAEKSYFYYQGSLTSPPCTEGVSWVVFKDPITATPAQILELRRAIGGDNARPVQNLNGRKVYYSKGM